MVAEPWQNRQVITPPYRYVLFDWDGCLAQTLDAWLNAYRATLARLELFPSDADITAQFGDWDGVRGLGVSTDQYAAWKADMLAEVNQRVASVDLYPGAGSLVSQLREAHVATAIITTSHRENIQPALARTGMADLFDVVLTADDVTRHKPDPEPLHEALRRLGGSTEHAVMVGDAKTDLGAARNAGMHSALMHPEAHRSFHSLEELLTFEPTYVCDSFPALGAILLPVTAEGASC